MNTIQNPYFVKTGVLIVNSLIDERRPLYWALHATYLEYLSENNLNTDNEIIPFYYIQVVEIFILIGEHYEYYVGSDIKDLTNISIPKRKLKKELSDYETTVYKNMHKFCKEFIKIFVAKYKALSEDDKNDFEGYKKALLSNEEFITICNNIEKESKSH